MPATKPRVRPDLTVVELDDEAVVYDPRTASVHHLNATAALVLQLCDGTATVRQTIEELAGAYGVSFDSVESEVRSLVRRFRGAGLVASRPEVERSPDGHVENRREKVRREVPRSD